MSETPPGQTREERLAAKLRENLRRRKVQAREMASEPANELAGDSQHALPKKPPTG